MITGVHCHTMNNIAEFPYDYISIQSLRDRIKTVMRCNTLTLLAVTYYNSSKGTGCAKDIFAQ